MAVGSFVDRSRKFSGTEEEGEPFLAFPAASHKFIRGFLVLDLVGLGDKGRCLRPE